MLYLELNSMKKNIIIVFLSVVILTGVISGACAVYASGADEASETQVIKTFTYVHDPMENETVRKDAIADESAVYGFRPSDTGSLKQYADVDWSDPEVVDKGRRDRIAYHKSIESMYTMLEEMTAEGKTTEEIARALSAERNRIRIDSYKDDPEGLEVMKQRNLEKYGREEGPLPDELYEQYGSWSTVAAKAFSLNAAMDACLGLYDEYYGVYQKVADLIDRETENTEQNPSTGDADIMICISVISASVICFCVSATLRKRRIHN